MNRIGQVGFTASENKKLTAVELRDDGLLEYEAGRL